jgi:hypothetical protein
MTLFHGHKGVGNDGRANWTIVMSVTRLIDFDASTPYRMHVAAVA